MKCLSIQDRSSKLARRGREPHRETRAFVPSSRRHSQKRPAPRRRFRHIPAAQLKRENIPIQQRVLSGFLNLTSLPYSSYIPAPLTFLHRVDPRIKQLGTVFLLFLLTRCGPKGQVLIAGWLLGLTLVNTPLRIARPTLMPLLTMSAIYFILTACLSDGSPPGIQSHVPSESLDGFSSLSDTKPYSYVLFKFWFLNVTRKSIRLGVSTVSLVFVALQSASLCLTTTPPEQLALSLQQIISPLQIFRVPVREIGFCLLLSIRFLSTVFDELRNLALGVAVRGIDWKAMGPMGSLQLLSSVMSQLFRKLFQTSDYVAQAMVIRGFVGPERHHLYLMHQQKLHPLTNACAILVLCGLSWLVLWID